jgi:hypothetical protein
MHSAETDDRARGRVLPARTGEPWIRVTPLPRSTRRATKQLANALPVHCPHSIPAQRHCIGGERAGQTLPHTNVPCSPGCLPSYPPAHLLAVATALRLNSPPSAVSKAALH